MVDASTMTSPVRLAARSRPHRSAPRTAAAALAVAGAFAAACTALAPTAYAAPTIAATTSPAFRLLPFVHSTPTVGPADAMHPARLRAAYGLPATADGAGRTIALLQFSGFDRSAVAAFTTQAGLPDVDIDVESVDGAVTDVASTDAGGLEATLDSDAVAVMAPAAHQQVYVAPNSPTGFVDALDRIAVDAADEPTLDALSISWGVCDRAVAAATGYREALEAALARLVAEGVSVFAGSGDTGPYGCAHFPVADRTLDTQFPASSASVVAVGGTRLTLLPGAAPDERAWSDPQPDAMTWPGWGSGGGQSTAVVRPDWQSAIDRPGAGRLVPDLAAAASSFPAFTLPYAGASRAVTGTSLAAPLVAGGVVATLASTGTPRRGDLHPLLYGTPGLTRDITRGDNLRYPATAGYDLATGLGVPRFDRLAPMLAGTPAVRLPRIARTRRPVIGVVLPADRDYVGVATGFGSTPRCADLVPVDHQLRLPAGRQGRHAVWVAARDVEGFCHVTHTAVVIDSAAPALHAHVRRPAARRGVFALTWSAADRTTGVASIRLVVHAGRFVVFRGPVTGHRWHVRGAPYGRYRARLVATDAAGNTRSTTLRAVLRRPR